MNTATATNFTTCVLYTWVYYRHWH